MELFSNLPQSVMGKGQALIRIKSKVYLTPESGVSPSVLGCRLTEAKPSLRPCRPVFQLVVLHLSGAIELLPAVGFPASPA